MGFFSSNSTLVSVSNGIASFVNLLISVLAPLALVVFFWGLVRYVYHSEDSHAHTEARETISWSLIALFVLFSVWGILQFLNSSFFGGTVGAPLNIIAPGTSVGPSGGTSAGTTGGVNGGLGGVY